MKFLPHSAMASAQWEITKGHLRAMVAIAGAVSSGDTERPYRFERVGAAVEQFIKDFEGNGFHEGGD